MLLVQVCVVRVKRWSDDQYVVFGSIWAPHSRRAWVLSFIRGQLAYEAMFECRNIRQSQVCRRRKSLVTFLAVPVGVAGSIILDACHGLGRAGDAADGAQWRELSSARAGVVLRGVSGMLRGLRRWGRRLLLRLRLLLLLLRRRRWRSVCAVLRSVASVCLELSAQHLVLTHIRVATRLQLLNVVLLLTMFIDGCMLLASNPVM